MERGREERGRGGEERRGEELFDENKAQRTGFVGKTCVLSS